MSLSPVALTMGEPAGISGEITIKAWLRRHDDELPAFFAIDDPVRLAHLADKMGWPAPIAEIDSPEDTPAVFGDALPVLARPLPGRTLPGDPDPANAVAVQSSIEEAVGFTTAGRAAAVVTNPIHKSVLYEAGFKHAGHTEYLAELAGGVDRPVMMLCCDGLRVVPVTGHLSLREAVEQLHAADIEATARIVWRALEFDFGIEQPHIAVAALNPHAGEQGAMGREEIEIIGPAVELLKKEGLSISGPAPADTLFHERARKSYDAAICMYHDQALIPLKTIDFSCGVNVTLGLPFVRTSPDHGTAFEIAGTGVADESSLVAALKMATSIATRRQTIQIRGASAV